MEYRWQRESDREVSGPTADYLTPSVWLIGTWFVGKAGPGVQSFGTGQVSQSGWTAT